MLLLLLLLIPPLSIALAAVMDWCSNLETKILHQGADKDVSPMSACRSLIHLIVMENLVTYPIVSGTTTARPNLPLPIIRVSPDLMHRGGGPLVHVTPDSGEISSCRSENSHVARMSDT